MVLRIDLSEYCDPEVIAEGNAFYREYGASHVECRPLVDGTFRLSAKMVDGFQFVNHPWITVDESGEKIQRFYCDCAHVKSRQAPCEHCVALLLELMGHAPVQTLPREAVAPVEVQPVIVPPVQPVICPAVPPVADPVILPEPPEEPVEAPEEAPVQAPAEVLPPRSMEILFGNLKQPEEQEEPPVHWYPNDTERSFHTNMGIIGTMGTGKTQFTKSIVTQLYRNRQDNYNGSPIGILIFDYKGDYNETKTDFVHATNAKVLKPYRLPFNPLALNQGKAFKPLLPMHTANEFKDTISQIFHLGPKQQQVLLDCIVKAYAKQGIEPANPATWSRKAPTLDQVYHIFSEETLGRPVDSLTAAMNKLYQFCLFEGDPRRAVSLERLLNGVVVIDLSGYDNDIQSLIVAITLNQFYAQMQMRGSSLTDGRYRQMRSLILVDEADGFMSQGFPSLRKIMKEGREFGVGVILSTQSLTHFIGGDDDYSRYVLTWVVHNVSDLKQKDVEYVFKLQPKSNQVLKHYTAIKGLAKHESVVKLSNDDPITIRDKAFWQLYKQLTSQAT